MVKHVLKEFCGRPSNTSDLLNVFLKVRIASRSLSGWGELLGFLQHFHGFIPHCYWYMTLLRDGLQNTRWMNRWFFLSLTEIYAVEKLQTWSMFIDHFLQADLFSEVVFSQVYIIWSEQYQYFPVP